MKRGIGPAVGFWRKGLTELYPPPLGSGLYGGGGGEGLAFRSLAGAGIQWEPLEGAHE